MSPKNNWYLTLRGSLHRTIAQRIIRSGEVITDQAIGIGANLLLLIQISNMKRKDCQKAMYERVTQLCSWYAGGRAGEVQFLTYDTFAWNFDVNMLIWDWSDSKTSRQKLMLIAANFLHMEIDIFHAFCECMLLCVVLKKKLTIVIALSLF